MLTGATPAAAQIAAPSGFRCYGLLGVADITVTWPAASPSVSAPYSYRYVLAAPSYTATVPAPSAVLSPKLLNIGAVSVSARAELLRSGSPQWTSSPGTFFPAPLLGWTNC